MTSTSTPIPIRRVRRDAQVDLLGHYRPDAGSLHLTGHGFPLHGPGEHTIEGDLPWVFYDIAPAGYLARRFARWFPELQLQPDSRLWSASDVLAAITERGHDLPGNLVIGEGSWERFRRIFGPGHEPGPSRSEARGFYARLAGDVITDMGAPSSIGGERPKFTLRLANGAALLVKFTPPLSQQFGVRWADLLRFEAHCLATLRSAGMSTVQAEYVEIDDRGYLEVDRFDRIQGGGRAGVVTLSWLGASRYGEARDPIRVIDELRKEGRVTADGRRTLGLVHAFSGAIGNTDTHLGNYALTVGDEGEIGVAPFYDVLPMVFAPRHDELPDAHVRELAPSPDPTVRALVADLVERVTGDARISPELLERWRRHVGA